MNAVPTPAQFNAAAEAAEFAANSTSVEQDLVAMTRLLRHQRTIELCQAKQALDRFGGPPPDHERLPLMDDSGYEYGRVVARIPAALFYGLEFQRDFGREAFHTKEGIEDICKAFPVCRTKTVSGKTVVAFSDKTPNRVKPGGHAVNTKSRGVTFGRGTIRLAE
jgi:hypothetical protein